MIRDFNVHIGRVYQVVELVKLVPNLTLKDGLGSDGKSITPNEICFAFVTEVGVVL